MGITMDNVTGVQLDTDPTSLINGFDLTESLTGQKTGKSTADVVMAGGTGERSSAQVYADALEAAGKEWNASKARGDKRGMDAAAWYANKVRAVGEGNITVQKAMSLAGDTYHTGTGAHTAAHNIAEMLRKKDPTTYGKYAKGSKHAKSGLARPLEEGEEHMFSARNGNQYKMLNGGEKILNANATDFLYDLANKKVSAWKEGLGATGAQDAASVNATNYAPSISVGDIVIQGNANEKTVSEIRRAQRDQVNFILSEFRKMATA